MQPVVAEVPPQPGSGDTGLRPTVWGLAANELHDAYWRACGVQCIRRGQPEKLQAAAELFLLIERGQLVLFDLGSLVDRLAWRAAALTRLRIVDEEDRAYGERIVVDERGLVERIARRYRPRTHGAYRVMLTSSRRIARVWMVASTPRKGWEEARRSVTWSRVDHWRCAGKCFSEGDAAQERALISRLVACWADPAQVIDGIKQAREQVWTKVGDPVAEDAILAGPVWLGCGGLPEANACLIGPAWTADRPADNAQDLTRARVRSISDVELGEIRGNARGAAKPGAGYAVAKRTFDIIVSIIVLLVALPFFVIVAASIILEDGRPVFYGHLRQSRGGRPFRCWKFRTMCRNADKLTAELAGKNICDGPQVFIKDDPRLTWVGHYLRRFQIDEMPQFFNVLMGQMSVVGPRPSPEEENQYSPAWRDLRLSVRPGITGLWQLKRTRAPGQDFQEWIKYDIEYVRRASLWFDVSLCIETVWLLLLGKRS